MNLAVLYMAYHAVYADISVQQALYNYSYFAMWLIIVLAPLLFIAALTHKVIQKHFGAYLVNMLIEYVGWYLIFHSSPIQPLDISNWDNWDLNKLFVGLVCMVYAYLADKNTSIKFKMDMNQHDNPKRNPSPTTLCNKA